jgi:hypothetical protein
MGGAIIFPTAAKGAAIGGPITAKGTKSVYRAMSIILVVRSGADSVAETAADLLVSRFLFRNTRRATVVELALQIKNI